MKVKKFATSSKSIAGMVVSAALLMALLINVDILKVLSILSTSDLKLVLLGFVFGNLTVLTQGYSWFKVFRRLEHNISLIR